LFDYSNEDYQKLAQKHGMAGYGNVEALARSFCRGRIVELGCGKTPLFDGIRTDIVPDAGLSIKKVDCNSPLPWSDGSFDTVVAIELIEHLNDHETFLHECNRILREGGRLFLTTPNMDYWKIRLAKLKGDTVKYRRLCGFDTGEHQHVFTNVEIRRALEDAGFAVKQRSQGRIPFVSLAGGTINLAIKNDDQYQEREPTEGKE
jgi:SAM-dependent methyltransferase